MNVSWYWIYLELGMVVFILLLVFVIFRKFQSKQRAGAPVLRRIVNVVSFGLAALLLVIIFLLAERSALAVYTETRPAPSVVDVPPNLAFEVEEVSFPGWDGATLAGWRVPSRNGATIILLHGYGGNRKAMLWYATYLIESGYGALLYDERASGESGGTYRSYGWEDTADVESAIEFIRQQNPNERIGAAGCSTGASIVVYSAALYPEIGAVWGDGNSSVRAQDLPAPANPLMALVTASNYMIDGMYALKLGITPPAPLTEVLDQIAPRPLMLVGGGKPLPLLGSEGDAYTLRFAALAGDNAQTWVISEATHCNGPTLRPQEYAKRLVDFFDDALLK